MHYRDAGEVLRSEDDLAISKAARGMCEALGLEDRSHFEQARMLALSLLVFAERDAATPDAWKAVGYIGNLLAAHGKSLRLMNSLYWNRETAADVRREKPLDNAIDAIVYFTFFSRAYLAEDEFGSNPAYSHKEK